MAPDEARGKIINIDDNETNRYLRSRILRHAGYHVIEAAMGQQALDLAASERPDLALLDINLPDINGIEVCRRIKAKGPTSVLVLAVSALSIHTRDRVLALQHGADGYLIEPVEPAELLATVNALLRLRKAEQALHQSDIRMRALLDASQDEILLLSTQGEVLAINEAAERRLANRMGGSTPVGVRLERLLPRDQAEQRMAIVRQVAATAKLVHCEVPIRSRWFEFWFYPVLQAGRPVSEVAVYAREITEQKKSQADLSKLFQAVQQSPMSVVITDRDGNIEYVNPEFTKVTGYALVEAIGRNPRIIKSEQMPPEHYAELWRTITSGGVWRGEFRNKKKNGELFWELASIAPVKDGENIINFVAVKENITERKQTEEQLRQAQKMQAVGQLTGGIAHDFNNLLAIITGNLQLLGERVGGDARIREYLDDALWSAKRGAELTHRLLVFSRRQPLKPDVIDLNDVVRGMTELLRRTLGASIRIEESLAPNLWKAFTDRGELERALVNLAVNSGCDAQRRHAHAGDAQCCPRRGLCRAVRGGDARRVRAARRCRYRNRHASRNQGTGVRAVLHDEGGGTG